MFFYKDFKIGDSVYYIPSTYESEVKIGTIINITEDTNETFYELDDLPGVFLSEEMLSYNKEDLTIDDLLE